MRKALISILGIWLSFLLVGCGLSNSSDSETFESSEQENIQYQNDVIQSESQTFEYPADLTQDGKDECIKVCIEDGFGQEETQVKIQVYDTSKLLYESELFVHSNLGESYYLLSYNGNDYFMYYKPSVNHDTALCSYEVFYLNEAGEKITYDSNEIEISLFDVQELDKNAWKAFAEQENRYFENAFLLASTNDAVLEYSTNDLKKTYTENFSWLIKDEMVEDIETALERFIQETQEVYKK